MAKVIIYLIENKLNGKQYVGQTTGPLKQRWQSHYSCNLPHTYIDRAIKKYSKDNFEIKQIDIANSIEELNVKEIYWIKELNTLSPNGYNIREGGNNSFLSQKTKDKISKANSGRQGFWRGKKFSESHIKNWKDSRKGFSFSEESKNLMREVHIGKKHSKETREKIRQKALGRRLSSDTKIKIGSKTSNTMKEVWRKRKCQLSH